MEAAQIVAPTEPDEATSPAPPCVAISALPEAGARVVPSPPALRSCSLAPVARPGVFVPSYPPARRANVPRSVAGT